MAAGGAEHCLDSVAAVEDAVMLKGEVHPLNSMYDVDDESTDATNRVLVTIPGTRAYYY